MQGEDHPTIADADAAASFAASFAAADAVPSDLVGQVFNGRYRIVRTVGAGSMGDVFEGIRLIDGCAIAIKVLKSELSHRDLFRHRFLREAKAAVPIDHPNVVDVLDFGVSEDGRLYIAMEFLRGEALSEYLQRLQRLSWRQSCALLQQAASGLAAAHAQGVVHRDVKPSNILLVDDAAGGARVKIVDFGVAKLAGQPVSRVLTQVDDVIGTVAYMSPEQAEGREADCRSDIYALGVTAYELATGDVPFDGRDIFEVLMGHLQRAPVPPAELIPDFPPAANAFILRCLAKDPAARYATMEEVVAALHDAASPDSVVLPPPMLATASVPAATPGPSDAPEHDDEAPTGYFFRPVQPSVPVPVPVPAHAHAHARRSTTPTPIVAVPSSIPASPHAAGPSASAEPSTTVRTPVLPTEHPSFRTGGTVPMPSLRAPPTAPPAASVDDGDALREPAGILSRIAMLLAVAAILAVTAVLVLLIRTR